ALRRMAPEFQKELDAADPALARMAPLWAEASDPAQPTEKIRAHINELAALLRKTCEECKAEKIPEALPAMAAFALSDIDSDESRSILYETFLSEQTEHDTLWAITDALALLDPEDVMKKVVHELIPTLDQLKDSNFDISMTPSATRREMLVLL